jgi:hypothetical protein
MVPLGFCCGGFSSTAGLRPRQRGSTSEDVSGIAPDRPIISDGRYSFLSEQLEKPFGYSRKPFGFDPGVPGSGFPLLLPSNDTSPHPFHLQVPVKMPVSNFDYVMESTLVKITVKYKTL